MRFRWLLSLLSVCVMAVAVGCGGGSGGGSTPPPGNSVSASISPTTATALVAAPLKFTATVTGSSDTSVTFSVVEGAGGGQVAPNGDYIAPSAPGTYHVRVKSNVDPTKTADATVTVRDYSKTIARLPDASDAYYKESATLLTDGSVLVVGGRGFNGVHAQSERYVPAENRFVAGAILNNGRLAHTAIRLPSGKVFIVGGHDGVQVLNNTEIYDHALGTFTFGPNMAFPHRDHKATLLKDSRILITGGIQLLGSGFGATPNTELYDPATNQIALSARMNVGRWLHTATLLNDGRVLIVGGRDNNCTAACPFYSLASAEIYDPVTSQFSLTGSLNLSRFSHSAQLLSDGRVLILGGETTENIGATDQIATGEIYDPATGKFTPLGTMTRGRSDFSLTVLNNGKYLIAGGKDDSDLPSSTTEIYDPVTGTSTAGPEMNELRMGHSAVRLLTGEVLIVGGYNSGTAARPMDLFK